MNEYLSPIFREAAERLRRARTMGLWKRLVALLGVIVSFVTMFSFVSPAVAMNRDDLSVSAPRQTAEYADPIPVTVAANAQAVCIRVSGSNAGLSGSYAFADDVAAIQDHNGTALTLYRRVNPDCSIDYWYFPGESGGEVTLDFVNGADTLFLESKTVTLFPEGETTPTPAETTPTEAETTPSQTETSPIVTEPTPVTETVETVSVLQYGDPAADGSVSIRVGVGASLEEAMGNASEQLRLNWVAELPTAPIETTAPVQVTEPAETVPAETVPAETVAETTPAAKPVTSPAPPMFMALIPDEVVGSGSLNDDITWTVTQSSAGVKTLTISGTGDMPKYGDSVDHPWKDHTEAMHLVIEEGITSINEYNFARRSYLSVSLPSTLTSIAYRAFIGARFLSPLVIPGNVKTIGENAFFSCSLTSLTLEEGIEALGNYAFSFAAEPGHEVTLPASLKTYNNESIQNATAIHVAEGSEYFSSVDGVLYSKDGSILYSFPRYNPISEFTVPTSVSSIHIVAFSSTIYLQKLVFPDKEGTFSIPQQFATNSSLEEVYFGKGCVISNTNSAFSSCVNLHTITYHPDVVINTLSSPFGGCSSLRGYYIPPNTATMKTLNNPPAKFESLYYDATNLSINPGGGFGTGAKAFALTIGENVDTLHSRFYTVSSYASSISFDPNNQITIPDGAFDGAIAPFDSFIGGTYWVGAAGEVYRYDPQAKTATLVFCPAEVATLTIPAAITPEEGVICNVTAIGPDVLAQAGSLQSLTFEAPEQITSAEAYTFINCPTLITFNGKTTVSAAIASLPNADLGPSPFYGTGLTESASGSDTFTQSGVKEISCGNESASIHISSTAGNYSGEWVGDENGYYRQLTGDPILLNISLQASNTPDPVAFRIYLQRTEENFTFFESFHPGETFNSDGQDIYCSDTLDPDIFYLEILPNVGDTSNFALSFNYPSPGSAGGWMNAWVVQIPANQTETLAREVIAPAGDSLCFNWYTEFQTATMEVGFQYGNPPTLKVKQDANGILHPYSGSGSHPMHGWHVKINHEVADNTNYGQNYPQYLDHAVTVNLPDGCSFMPEVQSAVENGTLRYVYASNQQSCTAYYGNLPLVQVYSQTRCTLSNLNFSINENGDGVITYRDTSNNPLTALPNSNTCSIRLEPESIVIDPDQITEDSDINFHMTDEATIRYLHGGSYTFSGSYDYPQILKSKLDSNLSILKTPVYFGEDYFIHFTTTNTAALHYYATEPGAYYYNMDMTNKYYLKPDNMELMFREAHGDKLTVTIKNAHLAPFSEVSGIHGGTAYQNVANSDLAGETGGNTLVITPTQTGYAVSVNGAASVSGADLSALLQAVGFSVTPDTTYNLQWIMSDPNETFTLKAGEVLSVNLYATAKDTFGIITDDERSSTNSQRCNLWSNFSLRNPKGKEVSSLAPHVGSPTIKQEITLHKEMFYQNQSLNPNQPIPDESVLDYQIRFQHFGSGEYENLPMVDDLFGDQFLLIPKAQNPDHPQLRDLEVFTDSGVEYYILTEGTYSDVVVGIEDGSQWCTAESIVVHRNCGEPTNIFDTDFLQRTFDDVHTRIKWYYPTLSDTGNYTITINYKVLASIKRGEGLEFNTNNVIWLNDKQKTRLYNYISIGHTVLELDKNIVTQRGDVPANDILGEDYTLLNAGDTITYRLSVDGVKNGSTYTFYGNEFTDALPRVPSGYQWSAEDIQIEVVASHPEKITGDLTADWILTDAYQFMNPEPGQQFILWDEDVSVTLEGEESTLYIYITLTYPTGEEWDALVHANGGNVLMNKFLVLSGDAEVFHDVYETGSVLLQKGVFSTERTDSILPANTTRAHFASTSAGDKRFVTYYALIYNDGSKRLYLDTLYDILPEGVTYHTMNSGISGRNSSQITTQSGDTCRYLEGPEDISFRCANVSAIADGNQIRFTFTAGDGDYALRYDERVNRYYLDQGEAIAFTYLCLMGSYEKTTDTIVNTLAMPYRDLVDAAPRVSDAEFIAAATENFPLFDQNNGSCAVVSQTSVAEKYGLSDVGSHYWLVSDVTQTYDLSTPGIDKLAQYYSLSGSALLPYEGYALPSATIYWKVTVFNEGNSPLHTYTLEDALPYPYSFQGPITYQTYYADGTPKVSGTLFTVGTRGKNDTAFSLDSTTYNLGPTYSVSGKTFRLIREGQNEHLTLGFNNSVVIPEHGYAEFLLPTVNAYDILRSAVYTNQAIVKVPQAFDPNLVHRGSILRNESGTLMGVMDAASIVTSNVAATSSVKQVTEIARPDNTATSSGYIILENRESNFRYSLNVTSKVATGDMGYLTIIDTLPQPGDHSLFDASVPRNSEFTVSLAEDPDFTVTLLTKNADGTTVETPLTQDQYTIRFCDATGVFSDEDWQGSMDGWTTDPSGARAIRVCIPDATFIPDKGTICISFNAQIDGDADHGSTAWNGFGYHYGLHQSSGTMLELEAMPPDVGVKMPTVPKIRKELLDVLGNPMPAPADLTSRFLVHEGESLRGNWTTEAALVALLEESDVAYHTFTVTVPEGETESSVQYLIDDRWQWADGKSYTIVELPSESDFRFTSFNSSTAKSFTFTYYAYRNTVIQCVNTSLSWNLEVLKVDGVTAEQLSGALFGLYTRDPEKQLSEDAYNALTHKPSAQLSVDGDIWYLSEVASTDESGRILWSGLEESSYYLLEIRPPAGYQASAAPGQIINRSNVSGGTVSVTVENFAGYELPKTGGFGVGFTHTAALVLMLSAVLGILPRLKKYLLHAKH